MLQDIIFAAILALILTWLIRAASRVISVVFTQSIDVGYSPGDSDIILQRCCRIFPIENLRFKGAIFRRGMVVRVVLSGKNIIEGKFIGTNEEDMVCFMTGSYVITRRLENIVEMRVVRE